jgi:hypothetical protein
MKKYIFILGLILIALMSLNATAIFYSVETNTGVKILEGDTPLPTNAIMANASTIRYTVQEKYLKVVDGVIVEKSAEEKHLIDLDPKYKNTDGTEMTAEQKKAVDDAIELDRQNSKSDMLKSLENLYVQFLTTDWTSTLRSNNIISATNTINVINTDTPQNITYLMQLRAVNRDSYINFASEFKLFEDGITKMGGRLEDCIIHN